MGRHQNPALTKPIVLVAGAKIAFTDRKPLFRDGHGHPREFVGPVAVAFK
jgi:hypothetical protein